MKCWLQQVVSVITEGLPQVFGANLVGGQVSYLPHICPTSPIFGNKNHLCLQVLLQPTSETPEPDLKRRKRAR